MATGACADREQREIPAAVDSTALRVPARVNEAFVALTDTAPELRGLASWRPVTGESALLVSAPADNAIQVRDVATGLLRQEYRRRGRSIGALGEPIGLAAHDSVLFVVERSNHRVQAFRLPGFEPIGVFGAEELIAPEWITLLRQGRFIDAYVSDRADQVEDTAPASRIRIFRVTLSANQIAAGLMRTFGADAGLGGIHSLAIDSAQGRLLVADRIAGVVAFTLGGDIAGLNIPRDVFAGAAVGLALRTCGRESGYWFASDTANSFHVFDRETLAPVTRFWGRTLAPTAALSFDNEVDAATSNLIGVHSRSGVGAIAWPVMADSIPALRGCTSAS